MGGSEKRRSERKSVQWAVHARGDDVTLVGATACDVSDSGIFVHPALERRLPEQGTPLRMTVFTHGFGSGVEARGVVRWVGHSAEHHCDGIGIEFADGATAQRLWRDSNI